LVGDLFIIRAIWRKVNQPPLHSRDTGSIPADGNPTRDEPIVGSFGVASSCLSGMLGCLVWLMAAPPQALVWSIPVMAIIGIFLGIRARKGQLGKTAIVVGALNLAIWFAIALLVHTPSSDNGAAETFVQNAQAQVRYHVFEADPALVDRMVSPGVRQRSDARPTDLLYGGGPPNAVSQTAEIPSETLATLLKDRNSDVFGQASRTVIMWPRMADTFSYAQTNGGGVGGLGGFEGIKSDHGALNFRLEYHIDHSVKAREAVSADIFLEGAAPVVGRARCFFIPFTRSDGKFRYLIVAFEVFP
jgi:hypothetical protein